MSVIQSGKESVTSGKLDPSPRGKPGAATLIELGIALARAEVNAPETEPCRHCGGYRNASISTARFPKVFCSEECEQQFVRNALASLTVENSVRMSERLDNLLTDTLESALSI